MDTRPAFSIRVVARRTGLGTHQIRAWERRYGAVVPQRSAGGHRLYSEADIERLRLLHRLTNAGHPIGQLARLSPEALGALAHSIPPDPPLAAEALVRCLAGANRLDPAALDLELNRAHAELGHHVLVDQLLTPLLTQTGLLWQQGTLPIAVEHLITEVVRSFLGRLQASAAPPPEAPLLVATTPAGQRHELGALLAAHAALSAGWRAVFLGPDLPAEEIAFACRRSGARALALSLVFPTGDPDLPGELVRLRNLVGPRLAVLAGGSAAPGYQPALEAVGFHLVPDLAELRYTLAQLEGQ